MDAGSSLTLSWASCQVLRYMLAVVKTCSAFKDAYGLGKHMGDDAALQHCSLRSVEIFYSAPKPTGLVLSVLQDAITLIAPPLHNRPMLRSRRASSRSAV